MKNSYPTLSKLYGPRPALDNFDINKVLSDIQAATQKAQGIASNVKSIGVPTSTQVAPTMSGQIAAAPSTSLGVGSGAILTWVLLGIAFIVIMVMIFRK